MMLMHGLRILTAFMLVSYTAVSLCGPGHHALDGLIGHIASPGGSAAHPHDSPETTVRADMGCPACHFFSLASLAKLVAPLMVRLPVDPAPNRLDWIRPSRPLLIASSPRAPPRLAV